MRTQNLQELQHLEYFILSMSLDCSHFYFGSGKIQMSESMTLNIWHYGLFVRNFQHGSCWTRWPFAFWSREPVVQCSQTWLPSLRKEWHMQCQVQPRNNYDCQGCPCYGGRERGGEEQNSHGDFTEAFVLSGYFWKIECSCVRGTMPLVRQL